MSAQAPDPCRIVLAGGGHSHALVLRELARRPIPGAELVLVSENALAPYSGMLPGEIAGHYDARQTQIDLPRLCAAAGARFVQARACGIDRAARHLLLEAGDALPYDLLSLNIGATPRLQVPGAAAHVVPVKPIARLREHWQALHARVLAHGGGPLHVAVVGAGAAGVELALAAHWRLSTELRARGPGAATLVVHLLAAGDSVLPTHNPRVRRRFERVLAARGIRVLHNARVAAVEAGMLRLDNGARLAVDEVLWVTQAGAAGWLAGTGMALDAGGFVRVRRTLQSVDDPRILAAGDVASIDGERLEKAGVVAVRHGPVLAGNLRRLATGQAPRPWRVQRRWLALISTGDRSAVASYGPWSASGPWVWLWKDWIDRRFMRQFEAY